jgi:hypothetical protein
MSKDNSTRKSLLPAQSAEKVSLRLDWATHQAAKFACERWHYSKCLPPSKLVKIGAWEKGVLIGVVVYGVGATRALLHPYGLTPEQGCELVRVAFFKHETPITRIISLSLIFLRKKCPRLRLIVSFADPAEGHNGGIYQGGNWIYTGRSEECKFPVVRGKVIHPRQMSRLVKRDGLKRNSVEYILKPGKHRYLMPLDQQMRTQIELLRKPYPKRAGSIVNDATPNQGV